jgi:hypothetical protein
MAEEKSPTRAEPDPYQARYMAEGALYYDKFKAPRAYHLIFLAPLVVILASMIGMVMQTGPAALLLGAFWTVLMGLVWLLFSVLRITVTRDEVYVQYGLFGPRIKISDIVRCEAVSYDWKKYGGWGIRYGRDGSVAYNMLGDQGQAVEIVYKKGDKEKKVVLSSRDPAKLAAAVNQARGHAGVTSATRIAADTSDASDEIQREAEAEAEAIAQEAEAEAKKQG